VVTEKPRKIGWGVIRLFSLEIMEKPTEGTDAVYREMLQ
jgi:hypothetical protein